MSSVPPVGGIPPENNNPNPDNKGRWEVLGSDKAPVPETPEFNPPADDIEVLRNTDNIHEGKPRIKGNAIISETEEFISEHEGQIITSIVIAGVVLTAAPVIAASIPALMLISEGLLATLTTTTANAITASALAGGAVLGSGLFQVAEASPSQVDPILLDLNGDGIKTTGFNDGIMFDHDNNGFSEWSTWVDPNDGVLVADLNQNGKIDDGTEILGDNGQHASDGYTALAQYDSNSDGVIN
jgi:hypothetical protein